MMGHDKLENKLILSIPVSGNNEKKFSGYSRIRINEAVD